MNNDNAEQNAGRMPALPTTASVESPLLSMRGIRKVFPGVKALDGVDFTLQRGEIHALMGENGAGKSTLIKVLTGVYPRDGGEVRLDGQLIMPRSPGEAQSAGISTVFQEVNLIPTLSIAENIFLGRQPTRFGCIDWKTIHERSLAAFARLNMHPDVTQPLGSVSIAIQQMAAIARALDISAKVLILDEPTSSLDKNEVERLFAALRKLKSEGLGIVFVTHFLDQVYSVTDRITVLRDGKLVGEYQTLALPRIELVARMMGKEVTEVTALSTREHRPSERIASSGATIPFVRVRGLGKRASIEPFDLDLNAGEVMGLAGLLGSGRTELVRLIFGIDRADSGTISADGNAVSLSSPREAIRLGFGFCPEDRKVEAIVPDLSVRENMILVLQAKAGWWRPIPRKRQQELADEYIRKLNIATSSAEKPIKLLSGGNQQKVILARWLLARPRLLMLDEPTRGIDVGAKFEIARLMEALCREGMTIVFVSSELEEVVRSSSRVVVLRDRRKIAELSGKQIDEAAIMQTIAQ